MVANVPHSVWRPAAARPGAWAFAILFAIESFSRATLASIVPIQAYDLLQNKQHVSMLYFAVGLVGLVATVSAPAFYRHIPRRWVYTAARSSSSS